jgi:hypothetical protein
MMTNLTLVTIMNADGYVRSQRSELFPLLKIKITEGSEHYRENSLLYRFITLVCIRYRTGTNVFSTVSTPPSIPPSFLFLFLLPFLFSVLALFFILQSFTFTQQFHTSHIYTKIIRTPNYNNFIQPNHSHKIHKLQHQFDTAKHNHTTTRTHEPSFQMSQEHMNHHFRYPKNTMLIGTRTCLPCRRPAPAWPCATTVSGWPAPRAARAGRLSLCHRPPACTAARARPPPPRRPHPHRGPPCPRWPALTSTAPRAILEAKAWRRGKC